MRKLFCIILLFLLLTTNVGQAQFNDSEPMFGQLLNLGHWSSDGLVFYWRGIPAGNVVDESLYGNHGTIIGPTWAGNALSFNGSSDYVSLGNPSVFDFVTSDCTVIAWIKMTSTAVDGGIVTAWGEAGVDEEQWALLFESTSPHIKWAFSNTTNDFFIADSPNWGIVAGQWYQIAGVRNGNVLKIYVDAVVSSDQPTITGTVRIYPGVKIGDFTRGGNSLNGLIRDVSIYNRALSASEIAALYLNSNLPMQQPAIWLFIPPVVTDGIIPIIQAHTRRRAG